MKSKLVLKIGFWLPVPVLFDFAPAPARPEVLKFARHAFRMDGNVEVVRQHFYKNIQQY